MYPVFMNISGKRCTVVGAGSVAQRRISALLKEKAQVTVIAPEQMPEKLSNSRLTYIQKQYTPELLAESDLVFAATDSPQLNEAIVRDAQKIGVLASSVTVCKDNTPDFSVPASRTAGNVTAAVSTNGAAPGLAGAICLEMERDIAGYAEICDMQEQLRIQWKHTIINARQRQKALRTLSSADMLRLYREKGKQAYWERAVQIGIRAAEEQKTAILVVSIGTSCESIREKTIGAAERAVQKAFPQTSVFRAFTGRRIVQKMRLGGIAVDTAEEALEHLKALGYTHVYCQPTFIIGGEEYDRLCAAAGKFAGHFTSLKIGKPLLFDKTDNPALAEALHDELEPSEDTAYLLMGHGTEHTANVVYTSFDRWLKQHGYPNVFVCTVKGCPTFDEVVKQLNETAYRKVVMLPLMLMAGYHAQNEMAGAEANSWKSILIQQGYHVDAKLRGLGEYPAVQQLYVRRIREMMDTTDFSTN